MKVKKTILEDGTIEYRDENGELHREDGPAVIMEPFGSKFWYKHGNLHRKDGPAAIFGDGSEHWYINGKCIATKKTTLKEMCEKNPEYLI